MNRQRGFTLIELMVVVVILGIIIMIAYPSYRNQAMKSRRSDAQVALTKASFKMESCRSDLSTYTGCTVPATTEFGLYAVSVAIAVDGNSYTLTAAPVAGKGQDQDTGCGSLTLTSRGVKGSTGGGADCWPG
ncbi:MAG: prepilin-type N-terminal cleavage/methylation domain-containing protein [Gammaproteobacteria bacterium]|nr:prepilin-type N-terminal cleavage/methylation domain-containing protein [Gammaproteobacteria bacterium]